MRRLVSVVLAVVLSLVTVGTVAAHWPVANRSSYVTQYYSTRHRGVDIGSYCGTRIYPSLSGTVVFSGWMNNGGGWQVWVRTPVSGLDIYTMYDHMRSRPPVIRGSVVTYQKSLIGYVGRTGNATGCHLHIAMWRGYPWHYSGGSYPINPWTYINHGYWFPYRYR